MKEDVRDIVSEFTVNRTHFDAFTSSIEQPLHWIGSRPVRRWSANIKADDALELLPNWLGDKPTRQDLIQLCADSDVAPEACFIAIMAWGGMKTRHGEKAWGQRAGWIKIVEALREGRHDRISAYAAFQRFRRENPGCGLGPAYFTKLIFFAGAGHDGYIMDQWTSLSINLLFGNPAHPLVALQTSVWRGRRSDSVTDANDCESYDRFCRAIEYLAKLLDRTAAETEERLFSQGGRREHAWREHVKANRPAVSLPSR